MIGPMYKKSVIEHFGSITATAKAIGVSRQAIHGWGEIIPELWAWKVEGKTRGKLKVNELLYESTAA